MLNPSLYDCAFDSFGTIQLTCTEDPQIFDEPLDLDTVRQYLRVDGNDEDDLISSLISAAREQAELLQGRVLVRKQFDLSFDYWPGYRIELATPTVSVDLVQYTTSDGSTVNLNEGVDYLVDLRKKPAIIVPPLSSTWPWFSPLPSSSVLIRFTAGYASDDYQFWNGAGAALKAGMLLLISAWFNNRLPFATGVSAIAEYPYAVSACLRNGSLRRPR